MYEGTKMAVMDTAKNCLNFQKERKSVFSFLTKFAVSNLVMWEVRYFFVIPFSVGVPIISATVLFLINKGIKMAMAGTINYFCNTIVSRANNYQSNEKINDIKMTLDIVPTNIKVGENLEGVDAPPIFKEGKYVIIKSSINPYFIRVVEDEKGEEQAYLMESIDEDIETLEEELPRYKKYIKILRLQNRELLTQEKN